MALKLFLALFATAGYALLVNVPRRLLLPAALGGMLSWGVYLLLKGGSRARFICSCWSARRRPRMPRRRRSSPRTRDDLPHSGADPLVPGSYVYYMMSALVLNKLSTMRHYGQLTAEWAFGLAAGIGLIAVLHQIASWKPREKH